MPSTSTTDSIGPRSVDEMLTVVYTRAERVRRRRTAQRLGAAAGAVLLVVVGMATLGGGDPDALVRTVDRPDGDAAATEEAVAPPTADAPAEPVGSAPPPGPAEPVRPSARAEGGHEVDATVKRPAAVPELPADTAKASVETWADDADGINDSTPADWYFDISTTTMQFDNEARAVVFRTTYRSPDAALDATRAGRVLESRFDYEGQTFAVSVHEANNQLGAVRVDNLFDCTTCSTGFDAAGSTLVLTVPLDTLNEAVTRRAAPLAAGADIMSLEALSFRANGAAKAGLADSSDMNDPNGS